MLSVGFKSDSSFMQKRDDADKVMTIIIITPNGKVFVEYQFRVAASKSRTNPRTFLKRSNVTSS